ncbi:MAG: heme exporter protein C [Oceanicoccus sp.]
MHLILNNPVSYKTDQNNKSASNKTAANGRWLWFFKMGSPRWFYQISGRCLPWLGGLSIFLLVLGVVWGLGFAPADFKQGNSYRIIFIHVPASTVSMAGYMLMATAAAISLIWKMKLAEVVMKCAAPIGAGMALISLFSGALWGKPTWGTYWVWDARLTSMLILFFLYLGVIGLYEAFEDNISASKACAVLSLVGSVNIPIIYWSVEWWNSLHQPATIKFTEESSMHPDMLQPLLVMIAGFYCFFGFLLLLYSRYEILQRERNTQWVKALVQTQLQSQVEK